MKIEAKLRAVAQGDRDIFADLFGEFQPRFHAYATGLLAGDREAAEDVVHDAFLAIWQQAGRFKGLGSAEGWMRRIVRNKAVDWCRKQREVPMTDELEARFSDHIADNGADPFQSAAQSIAARHLREALVMLSVEQREVVWLCYYEECSITEIADIARCPENTVKTRLFYARKILRDSGLLDSADAI